MIPASYVDKNFDRGGGGDTLTGGPHRKHRGYKPSLAVGSTKPQREFGGYSVIAFHREPGQIDQSLLVSRAGHHGQGLDGFVSFFDSPS